MTAVNRPVPVEPPYLLTAVADRPGVGVAVIADTGMAMVEVVAYGQWSSSLGDQVSAAVRMCLAGPSASIIVDLRALEDAGGVSLAFWLALWRRTRFTAESAHLAFCLPATVALGGLLRRLPEPHPRVFSSIPEARAAIAERLSRADRLQARLEPRPASVTAARALVAQACHAWHLPELLQDTWVIVSELAANAVEHAATDFVVTVYRNGTRLHVAIHDCVRRFPHTGAPALTTPQTALEERGRGLRLVHSIAAAWGAIPTREGKVVWATVR